MRSMKNGGGGGSPSARNLGHSKYRGAEAGTPVNAGTAATAARYSGEEGGGDGTDGSEAARDGN